MSLEIIIILGFVLVGFIILFFFLNHKLSRSRAVDPMLVEWLKSMQKTIEGTNKTINETVRLSTNDMATLLQTNSKDMNQRLDTAARVIGDLKKNLGEMAEVGKGIRSLQEFLQSPKVRGGLGEQVLKEMIGEAFPKNAFHLQYAFTSGVKVDAVLKTEAGLLCIDSKFPMENFIAMNKGELEEERSRAKKTFVADVKKHLSDISKKYILPDEGTMDFALMYVPSESVYYEIATNNAIMEEARNLRVYPVSPNTLYAHLQVLLLSFAGKELEQQSRKVVTLLRSIQKDYSKINEHLGTLGKHITNAHNTMSTVVGSFGLLGQKLEKTNLLEEKN